MSKWTVTVRYKKSRAIPLGCYRMEVCAYDAEDARVKALDLAVASTGAAREAFVVAIAGNCDYHA